MTTATRSELVDCLSVVSFASTVKMSNADPNLNPYSGLVARLAPAVARQFLDEMMNGDYSRADVMMLAEEIYHGTHPNRDLFAQALRLRINDDGTLGTLGALVVPDAVEEVGIGEDAFQQDAPTNLSLLSSTAGSRAGSTARTASTAASTRPSDPSAPSNGSPPSPGTGAAGTSLSG